MREPSIKGQESTEARGYLVARALRGSWREDPPPVELDSETLTQILPLLTTGGVSGLVWRRLRGTPLADSPAAVQLQEIYRYEVLRNAIHARGLKEAVSLLNAKGIESVLVKGWCLASFYPEPGVRPFGDIDLCVRPNDYQAAAAVLATLSNDRLDVDLHSGFGKFYDTREEELFARSRFHDLDGVDVRVLRFEDHFRFLCLHLLRHGGTRPLWLCDIATVLEAIPPDFDWDLCLTSEPRHAEWVAGAIGLASELLAADLEGFPVADRARRIPRWMVSTVLAEWGVPFAMPNQVASLLRRPGRLLGELPRHWPNPIEATINLGGGFNELPRWPFQVGDVVAKAFRLLVQTRGLTRAPN